jgi:hypothetical protein
LSVLLVKPQENTVPPVRYAPVQSFDGIWIVSHLLPELSHSINQMGGERQQRVNCESGKQQVRQRLCGLIYVERRELFASAQKATEVVPERRSFAANK